jgi:hypothetical protein
MTLIYVPAALLSFPREGRSRILALARSIFILAAHPLVISIKGFELLRAKYF